MKRRKITMNELEQPGRISALERDGFSREQIMKTMHAETTGMDRDKQRDLVSNLFDREKGRG